MKKLQIRQKFTVLCTSIWLISAVSAQTGDTATVDARGFELLQALGKSQLADGEILLFTTTHQDLGWIDHPEICTILRDTVWLTPFFKRLEREKDFKMDIEQTSIIMEYLHRHPESREKIGRWLREGRICVGATFVQPYEEMYSGEALARQFYLGQRWLKKTFGYSALSYFNVDVPGRTLQMPQIMSRAGVENLIISRHARGLFRWQSPDGSSVRAYSPGHYEFFYNKVLSRPDGDAFRILAQEAEIWYKNYNNIAGQKSVMPAMMNYEFIWDQTPAKNCDPLTARWNAIAFIRSAESGNTEPVRLPKFRFATADNFFAALNSTTDKLPTITGERPNVWVYIHGPSHERALTASRKGDILLPAAEKIASFNAIIDKNFSRYPARPLADAWQSKIYPDHGWGGKNGVITDNLFLQHFERALSAAENILAAEERRLSAQIKTKARKDAVPVVVFNSLSWKRSEPVRVAINLERGFARMAAICDDKARRLPSQLADVERYDDGSIRTATLCFVPSEIPPHGYATYYLTSRSDAEKPSPTLSDNTLENSFYRIKFSKGGIEQIRDLALGVDLLETSEYLAGEIATFRSQGNGAGEFSAVQLPTMEGFDKSSAHSPEWTVLETGEVYTSLRFRAPLRHAVAEQTVRVYHGIKKIDFDLSLKNWEGVLYREYRMMLPVNISDGELSYEVPYGVLRVGRDEMPGSAGERYDTPNRDLHPRGIGNWINLSGKQFGITLSSSVAVVDHVDPAGKSPAPVIQPVLMASRRSCHGEGNEYLQHGDHEMHFSLTSHDAGWQNGYRFGVGANETLRAIFAPEAFKGAKLPERYSFFAVDNPNVTVSAIKKCEDDESLVVRLYNLGDKAETLRFHSPIPIASIIRLNLIEEEIEEVSEIRLGAYAIETFKLKMK